MCNSNSIKHTSFKLYIPVSLDLITERETKCVWEAVLRARKALRAQIPVPSLSSTYTTKLTPHARLLIEMGCHDS